MNPANIAIAGKYLVLICINENPLLDNKNFMVQH
jgi:hypothetical protein